MGELVEALAPGGRAILNVEDRLVAGMAERSAAPVLTWGFHEGTVRGTDLTLDDRARIGFDLVVPDGLTALDGTGSSTFEDTIALLSLSQYQKHSDVIGETHAEFWTLTRASKKILDEMLTIKSDGTVRVNADPKFSASELRPVILLAPESEVEKEVQTEDAQA